MRRVGSLLVVSVLLCLSLSLAQVALARQGLSPDYSPSVLGGLAAEIKTPEQFAGFPIGADKKLVRWEKIVEYFEHVAANSDRIQVVEPGKTTMGNPFILAIISSSGNLSRLEELRKINKRLADPRGLTEAEAEKLVAEGKTVLLISCNIHSTEIGASQMVLELIHRLATEQSAFVQNILDNVIFLLVPSLNPDGQIMVTDWYNKNVGTEYEPSPMPWLYHKYTGHDNNRDAFMLTQVESQMINRVLYKDWFPQVYLDEHQMGSTGPRIFVPPFTNPINPNVDPVIWAEQGILGFAMNAALSEKNYEGVIYDYVFTGWWQGAFLHETWWHNMVGLLTEVASVRVATPTEQEIRKLGEAPPPAEEPDFEAQMRRDPTKPLPPPRDTIPRFNYPKPWLGGKWTLRNIVDYELAATYGLLEAAAVHRTMLLRNFYRLGLEQVEIGKKGKPYAFLVPPDQHDPIAAAEMLSILQAGGVEVHQAKKAFQADKKDYPAGTYVILMTQPYRAYAKDMLEKQKYPSLIKPGQQPERPYDVTGWTLPLQMGVKTVEVEEPFTAELEVRDTILPLIGSAGLQPGMYDASKAVTPMVEGSGKFGYLIEHRSNNAAIATNRFLKGGFKVGWLKEPVTLDGRSFPAGTIYIGSAKGLAEEAASISKALSLAVYGPSRAVAAPTHWLKPVRLGLYQPWVPSMDEGWTRWLLERYEFPYTTLHNADIKAGKLAEKFDAIIIADSSPRILREGWDMKWVREEYRGGLGEEGFAALKEFVRSGGTLITLGQSIRPFLEDFGLPIKDSVRGLPAEKFSCPGSLLKVFVDTGHPIGYGMPERATAMFYSSPAFELAPTFSTTAVRVVARYPSQNLLQSGWIRGEENITDDIAAADMSYGRGKVVAIGFPAQFRAQPHGTFKLFFNAIHYAKAE